MNEKIWIEENTDFKENSFQMKIIYVNDEFAKFKRNVWIIPIHAENVCNILPRLTDSNGLTNVKLRHELKYYGHFHF